MKRLPNLLTLLRMLGAAALIGLDVQRPAFWIIYALCGLSDMLDGHLARRLHAESALGGRLDSAADGLLPSSARSGCCRWAPFRAGYGFGSAA